MENLNELLVFDIETVAKYENYSEMTEKEKDIFTTFFYRRKVIDRIDYFETEPDGNRKYYEMAQSIPEFSVPICISLGRFVDGKPVVQSLTSDGTEESIIKMLKTFAKTIRNHPEMTLSGWNINGFDLPYLNRFFVKYGIEIPFAMSQRTKPWERKVIDLMEAWKGGKYDTLPGLELVSCFLNVSDSKEEMHGVDTSMIFRGKMRYSIEEGIKLIQRYCEADVCSTLEIANKMFLSHMI